VKLGGLTRSWTQPLVMRTYETNVKGEALFADEAAAFVEHGYEASMMSEEGGHIHAGRLLLTGGLSIFAGNKGIRAGGKHTITWKKLGRQPQARLGHRHDGDNHARDELTHETAKHCQKGTT
jgi:hypothetical protein